MAIDPTWERRKQHRLTVPASAVVFLEGVELGQFAVDNLSPSGALLTGELGAGRGDGLTILLNLAEHDPLDLDARVVRVDHVGATVKLGVEFEHWSSFTEDMLREALLGAGTGDLPPSDPTLPDLWEMDDPDLIEVIPQPP